jgi:hypothetical protein
MGMALKKLIGKRRTEILGRWIEEVLDGYPAESKLFLKNEKDRFRNPIGYTITDGLERILDGIIRGETRAVVEEAIEDIIRMRAVQQFSPSEAVEFLQPLKGLIREATEGFEAESSSVHGKEMYSDFQELNAEIDRLTLIAVDCYDRCREVIKRLSMRPVRTGGLSGVSIS